MMQRFKQRAETDGCRFIEPVLPETGVVVDVGCGNGALASWVANSNESVNVFALDKELNQLSLTQVLQTNLFYIESDAYALSLTDNSVDLIYLHAVCMYLVPLSTVLEECNRVLKIGGQIALRNGLSVVNNMELFVNGELLSKVLNHSLRKNSDNPNIAFTIPDILKSMHFYEISTNTSIESSRSIEEIQQVANSTIELLDGKIGNDALQENIITANELEELKMGIKEWSMDNKAYNKAVWIEHIYIKVKKYDRNSKLACKI